MVKVAITARNPLDNSLRQWGLGIDAVPTGNWLKDSSVIKSTKKSGELWNSDISISDGKHTLYFIVSTAQPENGTYAGVALFDIAGFNFSGVDNDSVAAFDINVKNGKATRASGTPATTPSTDLPSSGGLKTKWNNFVSSIRCIKDWPREKTIKVVIVAVAIPIAAVGIYYLVKRMRKNGFRRRF